MPHPTYLANPFVLENPFLKMKPESRPLPRFCDIRSRLPVPVWAGHPDALSCYWKAWELAFRNLRKPGKRTGFVANYIDTAFNNNLFMWDSCFILMFGRYGSRAFNFQRTLDNLYARQHPDGFISREIDETSGKERFERFNPSSTGPNILAWAEWEYYLNTGDKKRLTRVFPVLLAFHQWLRAFRTWPDGTCWSSGWGCGMDNQPRLPSTGHHPYVTHGSYDAWSHGHMSWIDTTLQHLFSARLLLKMAAVLKRTAEVRDIRLETERLEKFVNRSMWDNKSGFYCDRFRDGTLSKTKSIAAFWALLSGTATGTRAKKLVSHLENPKEFNRFHCVPSLSADHADYEKRGGYWKGGVWPPTNYMVLRGLTGAGEDALAHRIGLNHVQNVVKVFNDTGTLWENYAPDFPEHGDFHSTPDFVGWSGLSPITILFEYVFGLRADVPRNTLLWDVRLVEEHGVDGYPLGTKGLLSLRCAARKTAADAPAVTLRTSIPLTLKIKWKTGEKTLHLKP